MPPVPVRILILTASVGEGHDRPARWLAEQLRAERPDATVVVEDSLAPMGRVVSAVGEGAPRVIFYRLRWLWDLGFWAFTGPGPTRAFVQWLLTRFGAPGLLSLIERERPDVVVSVFPPATEVLARLRRKGRLAVPVVAGITDVAALDYWASRGAHVHLAAQAAAIAALRDIIGPDAAVHTVTGFTDPAFYAPRSRAEARVALSVPPGATLVVVSGGGWGVGDVQGAIEVALSVPGTTVVCLAGRNDALRALLAGFTEAMSDWLAAADVLVHSTGGLTVFEALLRGCPVVSYGWGRGHIRKHNEAFLRFGLAEVAQTKAELRTAIEHAIAGGRTKTSGFDDLSSAASFVLAACHAG